jgi:hypothetical protein
VSKNCDIEGLSVILMHTLTHCELSSRALPLPRFLTGSMPLLLQLQIMAQYQGKDMLGDSQMGFHSFRRCTKAPPRQRMQEERTCPNAGGADEVGWQGSIGVLHGTTRTGVVVSVCTIFGEPHLDRQNTIQTTSKSRVKTVTTSGNRAIPNASAINPTINGAVAPPICPMAAAADTAPT